MLPARAPELLEKVERSCIAVDRGFFFDHLRPLHKVACDETTQGTIFLAMDHLSLD